MIKNESIYNNSISFVNMKAFSYIISALLLIVNMHFTQVYAADQMRESTIMDCNTMCCSSDQSTNNEKPPCCSESYCSIVVNTVHVINYSYSPKIPANKSSIEFLPLVYTYTNFYTLSHTDDFWNPPKV